MSFRPAVTKDKGTLFGDHVGAASVPTTMSTSNVGGLNPLHMLAERTADSAVVETSTVTIDYTTQTISIVTDAAGDSTETVTQVYTTQTISIVTTPVPVGTTTVYETETSESSSDLVTVTTTVDARDDPSNTPPPPPATGTQRPGPWPQQVSCKTGNMQCDTVEMAKTCDRVINFAVHRSDDAIYFPGRWLGFDYDAPCLKTRGSRFRGCSMYIEGADWCNRTGNEIWWDYQDMKRIGCESCGWRAWGDRGECKTVVNFDDDCKRGSS